MTAPVPPEVLVETVARAIFTAETDRTMPPGWTWEAEPPHLRDEYRALAAAAIAAMPPSPAEEAVKRVEALAEEFDRPVAGITFGGIPQRALFGGGDVCYRIRAALASPAPAPPGEPFIRYGESVADGGDRWP